ncbi:hypothetical protein [Rheinheimera gaetbuli]
MAEHILIWVGSSLFFLVFIAFLGLNINKRLLGILIDSRGKMSLSRLQLFLWTMLFVPSIFTVGIAHDSMNILLSPELWALMGISLGSATGSIMIKGVKSAQEPAVDYLNLANFSKSRTGLLQTNSESTQAKFVDMFKGEEISDFDYMDISKVQMFFFTIAAWMGYVGVLYTHPFTEINGQIAFPALSAGIVTLIGISHTGYLTVKASDKTPKSQL